MSSCFFYFVKKAFGECSNNTLLIIRYDILKELIYKLNFEVCQIKSCVVIAIVLVSNVKNNLIFLILILWIQKFMNQSTRQMLYLSMTRNKRIKFKANCVAHVQIGYLFILFWYEDALYKILEFNIFTYLLIRKSFRAINNSDMFIKICWIYGLFDFLMFLLLLLILHCIYSCDEESVAIFFNVMNILILPLIGAWLIIIFNRDCLILFSLFIL